MVGNAEAFSVTAHNIVMVVLVKRQLKTLLMKGVMPDIEDKGDTPTSHCGRSAS